MPTYRWPNVLRWQQWIVMGSARSLYPDDEVMPRLSVEHIQGCPSRMDLRVDCTCPRVTVVMERIG